MADYCNPMSKGHNRNTVGWTYDSPTDLWVCAVCRLPSKAVYLLRKEN